METVNRQIRLEKAERHLQRLAYAAQAGRYKSRDHLLQRATKVLVLLGVDPLFQLDVSRRGRPRLHYRRNAVAVTRTARRDGLFVLRTNVFDLPADQVVAAYKSLGQVERQGPLADVTSDRR